MAAVGDVPVTVEKSLPVGLSHRGGLLKRSFLSLKSAVKAKWSGYYQPLL
jgi:hypothetical protein